MPSRRSGLSRERVKVLLPVGASAAIADKPTGPARPPRPAGSPSGRISQAIFFRDFWEKFFIVQQYQFPLAQSKTFALLSCTPRPRTLRRSFSREEWALSETERRAAQRFKLALPLVVRWQAESAGGVVTETRDVSSRGVYFLVPGAVQKDSPVELVMTLPHEVTLVGPVRVRCLGRVVRTEVRNGGRVGVVAVIERYEFLRGEGAV